MNQHTPSTRRSFMKRSGGATLAAALGAGIIPSLTTKLYATDTSTTTYGVQYTMQNGTPSVLPVANYNSADDARLHPPAGTAYATSNVWTDTTRLGSIDIVTTTTIRNCYSVLPNAACQLTIANTIILMCKSYFTKVTNGVSKTYFNTAYRRITRNFKCINGAPGIELLEIVEDASNGFYEIGNTTDPFNYTSTSGPLVTIIPGMPSEADALPGTLSWNQNANVDFMDLGLTTEVDPPLPSGSFPGSPRHGTPCGVPTCCVQSISL